jgi:gliding motility-associated peptidyl-prolyl isomerase
MKIKGFILILLISYGCSKNEARRPINPQPSTTLRYETVEESKVLNAIEVKRIEEYIAKDSIHSYEVSKNGFWYVYQNKVVEKSPFPKLGDEVIFEYNITDLEGNIIYSKEDLGIKNYKVDKEDFISALQKGIKLMKVGETVIFVVPSYHAFGISGDGNKIGMSQTIKSTITLLKIK